MEPMNKIKTFINRVYRLSLDYEKQENLVWEDLKKLHTDTEWKCGVYETDKYLETVFPIADETPGFYHYGFYEREFHCSVKVLEGFHSELATNIFLLASHFNNIIKVGVVEINVNSSTVQYRVKRDVLVPLLYSGEIYDQLIRHYDTSQDIYWAYQKLVVDNEEPALIIADLLKKRDDKVKEET
jgi:hypothetical protein